MTNDIDVLSLKHPVERGDYYISTNAIGTLFSYIDNWINIRIPGAIIYGYPRIGKSGAITYIMKSPELKELNVPFFRMSCKKRKNPNENLFFEDLLLCLKHELALVGKNTNLKRARLFNILLNIAEENFSNKIVLFLDEAQNLHELEYLWLMDIYNELAMENIHLIVFLIGQKELLTQRTIYTQAGKFQIVGRLMSQTYEFKGIENIEDLEEVLLGFDEFSEFPRGSGMSYTNFFFPEAYTNGFRLKNLCQEIWDAISIVKREHAIRESLDVPMQHMILLIERIFLSLGVKSKNYVEDIMRYIDIDILKAMFMQTGYLEWEINGRN